MKIGNNSGFNATTAKALREAKAKARAKVKTSTKANTNSLFQTLSNKKSTSSGKTTTSGSIQTAQLKKNYSSIKATADSLQTRATKLLASTDDSLFGKAIQKTDGDQKTEAELTANKEKVVTEINSFIQDYNSMIKTMSDTSETLNNLYLKQMKSFATESKAALKALGIVQKSDGTLTVNQKTLKSAETTKLQKVFGSKGSFTEKVSVKSKDAETNADIRLTILNKSNTYSSSGYLSTSYDSSGNLYNTKG